VSMRVLQVHNRHRARGGADEVLEQERTLLERAGDVVDQFLLDAAGEGSGGGLSQAVSAVWNRQACGELGTHIDRFDPDIVHVHTPFPLLSPAVFRTCTRRDRPVVTTVHSYRYSCIAGTCLRDQRPCEDCVGKTFKFDGLRHRCYHASTAASAALTLSLGVHHATGTFSRHVARFIALTDFAAALLVRDGIPAERVVVKPNSVSDPGPPAVMSGSLKGAVFTGRLVEEKGIRTLLDAWRMVGDRMPLRIAGDGPLRELVLKAAADTPGVTYLGWLSQDAVCELLAGSDLLVFPSQWYEAQPLVVLRALAAGRAVLCSDLENISSSVLASGAGAAFRTGDPAALADRVVELAERPEVLREMGRRARESYEAAYSPDRSLQALRAIYADVVRTA
jgi:glycosyltransferase involved in cell wall biosynthesis